MEDIEELLRLANQEDLGVVAGVLAEEVLKLRNGMSDLRAALGMDRDAPWDVVVAYAGAVRARLIRRVEF